MASDHIAMPGTGVAFWEPEEERKSPKGPDYKGFILLDRSYEKGEKLKLAIWQRNTSRGTTLLSLKEDTFSKDRRESEKAVQTSPKEDTQGYQKEAYGRYKKKVDYSTTKPQYNRDPDSDVPF